MAVGIAIETLSRSGATGLVTVNTVEPHPFVVGDKIRLYNVMGGGTAYPFMAGNPYTVGSVFVSGASAGLTTSTRFFYTQTGALNSADMITSVAITAGTPYANSRQYIQITTAEPHNLQAEPRIQIRGVTHPLGNIDLVQKINGKYQPRDVQVVNATTLILRLWRGYDTWTPGGSAVNWSAATLDYVPTGAVVALDDGINTTTGNIGGIGIITNQSRFWRLRSEGQVIDGVLKLAAQSKGIDYPFLRLFDPRDNSRMARPQTKTRIQINTAATTLRSALDTVIEAYQGVDAKKRRYYVNLDGQLVYEIVNDSQPPTATAPYKIIMSGAGNPNTSTSAATLAAHSLTLNWDMDTTKRALFTTSSRTGSPIADLIKVDSPDALGTAYKRLGAPYFDEQLDYPTGTDDRLITRQQAAAAFFLERHAPILSGSFTIKGAGTQSWNNLGYSSGYAQVTVPGSAIIAPGLEIPSPASRDLTTVTMTLFPFTHRFIAGMPITVSGIQDGNKPENATGTAYNGSYTVSGTTNEYVFTYSLPGGTGAGIIGYNAGDAQVVAYPVFIRTGTAPNQIVTVTSPTQHGIASGATIVVSGLTGTAGTSANGTATATVVNDYVYTYPSTGSNGTATGTATVTATTLVPRWEPGQWVDIQAPELGLGTIYRIEQVDWALEPGSFQQVITVTFNRKPGKTLTKLIREIT